MDTIQAILTRRSVRRFTSQTLEPEKLETILKAAMFAPSAVNAQPWQFVVFTQRGRLEEISRLHPHAGFMGGAAAGVLVCADDKLTRSQGHWMLDCSAATQNLLLAAHALGVGGVWIGIYPNPERMESLAAFAGLPENVHPVNLVALGYPADPLPVVDRFKPERIHRETY